MHLLASLPCLQVIKEKGSQLSRGYGFVSYAHPVYATVAMQHMNQQVRWAGLVELHSFRAFSLRRREPRNA